MLYCLISQAKNATSSIFPCLRCNSHSESRTIQVNNKIVKQITTSQTTDTFVAFLASSVDFQQVRGYSLWCSCIGSLTLITIRWGFSLSVSAEYLRHTVSSTRRHSSVNTSRNYVYIFLKRFFSMNENNEDINDRIINGSSIYISRIKTCPEAGLYYYRYAYCSREISATCRNSSRSLDSSVRRLMRTSLSSALTITFSKNSSTGSRSAASSISAS